MHRLRVRQRWLNYACTPNREAVEDEGRIFIFALRPVHAGEELFIDYQLAIDDARDDEARAQSLLSRHRRLGRSQQRAPPEASRHCAGKAFVVGG
ncbi:SET domain-containing protein-lysine N-methyltransferase [Paraburkholderia fungorum]|uniref:SET domain-containing protein-lysine N-methyltransferase n=1 Tax=Paraburkholderia fungorum TaxID=134537 RepID=UPI0038BD44B6